MEQSLNYSSMMRIIFSFFMLLSVSSIFHRKWQLTKDAAEVKLILYREDQFYFGFTYNTLQQKPAGVSQDKFSAGFQAVF
jgi:hypothetical protein